MFVFENWTSRGRLETTTRPKRHSFTDLSLVSISAKQAFEWRHSVGRVHVRQPTISCNVDFYLYKIRSMLVWTNSVWIRTHRGKNMGVVFLEHIGGTRLFSCASCDANLTNRTQLISTRFTGATGRAFLFNKVVNLNYR